MNRQSKADPAAFGTQCEFDHSLSDRGLMALRSRAQHRKRHATRPLDFKLLKTAYPLTRDDFAFSNFDLLGVVCLIACGVCLLVGMALNWPN